MKIGFSSLVCPAWDLQTIVSQASSLGFEAIELRGIRGELHLPLVPELASDPTAVRNMLQEKRVELACLASSASFTAKDQREVARHKAAVIEFLELASRLGCPYVRTFVGEVGKRDNCRAALSRAAQAIIALAPVAERLNVTILVENGGDFPGSADMWFLIDAVDSPFVRVCWNQCHALTLGERATNSIPRLGSKLGMVHVCDANFDESGALQEYKLLGTGHAELRREIELLKGIGYGGCLMFEWPKLWIDSLPAPESALPPAAKFLKEALAAKQPILSAYKGDKNAPKFQSGRPCGQRRLIVNAVVMEIAQAGLSDRLAWGIAACLAGAGVSLIGRKNARPGAGVVLFVFAVSAAVTLTVIKSSGLALAPVPQIAWTFALVSLLWSVAAAILEPTYHPPSLPGAPSFRSSSLFRLAALLFGVAAGIILMIVLVMRMIYVGVDLFRGYPWSVGRRHGFQADGLWTLLLLLISCVAAMLTGQARKLASCALWIAAIAAVWACLLGPPFRSDATGGFERSGMTVAMTASLGILLLIGAFVPRLIDGAREERSSLPGFAGSFATIAAGLVLLICYHMLVPVDLAWGGVGGRSS